MTSAGARLIDAQIPAEPRGVVLVLHGGASRGRAMVPVSPTQLSVLRMIPVARQIARSSSELAVLRLLNAYRGWAAGHTPVQDVGWALGIVAERFGSEMPVCLVGHSLGGRAALLSAAAPAVRGVVAMAPWVYPDDLVDGVDGTPVVVIHGDEDRVASPARSRAVAGAFRRETQVSYVTVTGGSHAMLGRRGVFDGLAAQCADWMLDGDGDGDGDVMARIAAGEPEITV